MLKRVERKRQENERNFKEIKGENSAEKAKLLSIVEDGNKNIASMKGGYEAQIRTIQIEMAANRRELIEVISTIQSKSFIF